MFWNPLMVAMELRTATSTSHTTDAAKNVGFIPIQSFKSVEIQSKLNKQVHILLFAYTAQNLTH